MGEWVLGSTLSLSLCLSISLSLSLSLSLRSTCRRSTTATSPGWTIDGPGRAGRQRQASPSLAVPCAEERIPRCGRRPAKLIKFTLGLQLVCRKQKKFAQSSPVGLHTVAKSLHFVCKWCAGSQKKFALSLPVSLHTVAISLHFVCTWFAIGLQEAEKFTCQFAFSSKSLHWHRNVYIRGYQTAEKVCIIAE